MEFREPLISINLKKAKFSNLNDSICLPHSNVFSYTAFNYLHIFNIIFDYTVEIYYEAFKFAILDTLAKLKLAHIFGSILSLVNMTFRLLLLRAQLTFSWVKCFPQTLLQYSQLEGMRSEISILYCRHYLHYVPRGDSITHVLSLKISNYQA